MREIKTKIDGFTLLELLVTLAIAAIITTVGIPSFSGLIRDSRMTAITNDFMTAFNYARSEAAVQNKDVRLLSTSGSAGDWASGWEVRVDANDDGDFTDSGELLRSHEAITNGYSLNVSSGITLGTQITYESTGLMKGVIGGTFFICENSDASSARSVVINSVGRARTESAAQCS